MVVVVAFVLAVVVMTMTVKMALMICVINFRDDNLLATPIILAAMTGCFPLPPNYLPHVLELQPVSYAPHRTHFCLNRLIISELNEMCVRIN